MKSRRGIVAILLTLCLFATGCASFDRVSDEKEDTLVLRLATDLEEASPGYRQLEDFQKRLSEQSDGRIQVKLYPSEQWSEDSSLIDYLGVDTLEMVCVSNQLAQTKVPAYEIFDLPYLFSDKRQVESYLTGTKGREALALLEPLGYQAVGFVGNGYQFFLQSRGSSVVIGWSGLTMSITQKPLWIQALSAIGVTAREASVDAGIVDARCADEAQVKKLMTQQIINEGTYLNDPDMFYNVEMLLCDQTWWNALAEADRALIDNCFAEALAQNMQSLQSAALTDIFGQNGITVDFVTTTQKEALYQATAGVRDQYFYNGTNPLAVQWIPAAVVQPEDTDKQQ